MDLNVNVFDAITVTENVTRATANAVLGTANVNDTSTVTEFVNVDVISDAFVEPSAFEDITITESVSLSFVSSPTIKFIDPVDGSDANSGNSWADAKKTIGSISGLTASDIVRVARSPSPQSLGLAQFVSIPRQPMVVVATPPIHSYVVALVSALTKFIDDFQTLGDWVSRTNITISNNTTNFKEGTQALSFVPAAAFTTGVMAHKPFMAAQDFSAYDRITFWIRPSAIIAANTLRINLCSDANGEIPVDSFDISFALMANVWFPITLLRNGGGNLGSNIGSVALVALLDPGTPTIVLDNMEAATSKLHLQTIIGKNESPTPGEGYLGLGTGDLAWYPIRSIRGRRIILGRSQQQNAESTTTNVIRYGGVEGFYEAYSRETIPLFNQTGSATMQTVVTAAKWEFGYDPSTGLRPDDGFTFFDNLHGQQIGFRMGNFDDVRVSRLGWVRCGPAGSANFDRVASAGPDRVIWEDCHAIGGEGFGFNNGINPFGELSCVFIRNYAIGCVTGVTIYGRQHRYIDCKFDGCVIGFSGASSTGVGGICHFKGCRFNANTQVGWHSSSRNGYASIFEDCEFKFNLTAGMRISSWSSGQTWKRCVIAKNETIGIYFEFPSSGGSQGFYTFIDCTFQQDNLGGHTDILYPGGNDHVDMLLINSPLLGGTLPYSVVQSATSSPKTRLREQRVGGSTTLHRITSPRGTIESDTVDFRTASPCLSMKSVSGITADPDKVFDVLETSFKAPVNAGQGKTLSIWIKAQASFSGNVLISARYNGALITERFSPSPALTSSYQQYSVSFDGSKIPADGVVELVVELDGTDIVRKVFLDDFSFVDYP